MFNDEVDKYLNLLQEGKVYKISKGRVKLANRRYNTTSSNYEIAFSQDTIIKEVSEDQSIGKIKFKFVPIDNLSNIEPNKFADIIGIVQSVGQLSTIMTRRGQEMQKRTIVLVDSSLLSVDMTVWGEEASKYNEETLADNPVVAIKSARVGEYGGRSLNLAMDSQFKMNLTTPQAKKLKAWYAERGITSTFTSISRNREGNAKYPRTPIKEANELGQSVEKPDTFTTHGRIIHIKIPPGDRVPWYASCPSTECRKKVIEDQGAWRCEKCQKSYPQPLYRWLLTFVLADHSESMWLTAFDETALKILKKKAVEVKAYLDNGDKESYEASFKNSLFQTGMFSVRAVTQISMNGNPLVKRVVVGLRPVDCKAESTRLLEEITNLESQLN